jgi:predicted aspartyl protease
VFGRDTPQGMTDNTLMGLTYVDGVVSGPLGERAVKFLIDTGAQASLLPHEVWRAIGLAPQKRLEFRLADGSAIFRDVSECLITLSEVAGERPRGHTPVILGEPGDVALLGVITLENLFLVFNPFDRSLRPMLEVPLMPVRAA